MDKENLNSKEKAKVIQEIEEELWRRYQSSISPEVMEVVAQINHRIRESLNKR